MAHRICNITITHLPVNRKDELDDTCCYEEEKVSFNRMLEFEIAINMDDTQSKIAITLHGGQLLIEGPSPDIHELRTIFHESITRTCTNIHILLHDIRYPTVPRSRSTIPRTGILGEAALPHVHHSILSPILE